MPITRFRFPLNTWQHLYSLHQAVSRADNQSANQLIVTGTIRNEALFDRHDMPVRLTFSVSTAPQYPRTADNQIILAQLLRNESLNAEIVVDLPIFNELKKNLVEYAGIEGIHIVMTIGLNLPESGWSKETPADIVQLDYAMKGDGG